MFNKYLCLICNKKEYVGKVILLCKRCRKNPYLIEDLRTKLSSTGKLSLFLNTYTKDYSEIKNINSKKFWDKKFTINSSLANQDAMTKEKINKVISLLPKNKPYKTLDLGFGQSYVEEKILKEKNSLKLYGIDISPIAVERVKKKFGLNNFTVGDVLQLNHLYKKGFFDIVLALELLEHVSPTKILTLLKRINFILKKKGMFIITCPINENLRNKTENPSGHVRDYSIPTLKAELSMSGFDVQEIYTFYAFSRFYFIKKILAKFLPHKWRSNNVLIKAVKI